MQHKPEPTAKPLVKKQSTVRRVVQPSKVPSGGDSSEGSPSPPRIQTGRRTFSLSRRFLGLKATKKKTESLTVDVQEAGNIPRSRSPMYLSSSSVGSSSVDKNFVEKDQTEAMEQQNPPSDQQRKETPETQVESSFDEPPRNDISTEMVTSDSQNSAVSIHATNGLWISHGVTCNLEELDRIGEDNAPILENLFRLEEVDSVRNTSVSSCSFLVNDSLVVERGGILSRTSDLDRTMSPEITGIPELLRSFLRYDFPEVSYVQDGVEQETVQELTSYVTSLEDERATLKTRVAAYKDNSLNQSQLVYNLQRKLVHYKARIQELEAQSEISHNQTKAGELQQISQMLEQEQSRVTSLVSLNSALREQLSKSQASNSELSSELQRLTQEWQNVRGMIDSKNLETNLEVKACSELQSIEHIRLLNLWQDVLKLRRSFVDVKGEVERQLKQIQMDFNSSARNASSVMTNFMALTGCEFCKEGDGLTTCWQRIKTLQADVGRIAAEKDSLHAQIEVLKIENRGLVSRLRDRDSLIQNLNKTVDHLQEQRNRSVEEHGLRNRAQEELERTLQVLRDLHRILADDCEESGDGEAIKSSRLSHGPIFPDSVVTMLRSVLDKKQLQLHDFQLTSVAAKQQLAEAERSHSSTKAERDVFERELQMLREDMQAINHRCEELTKQRDSCNNILESTTKDKMEISENYRKLAKDLEHLRREKASIQLSVTGLSLEKSQWTEEKESLLAQIKRWKLELSQSESQNTALREACDDLKSSVTQLRAEIHRVTLDRTLTEGQKKDVIANLSSCEKKRLELESDLTRYKSEILSLRDVVTRLEAASTNFVKEKSHLELALRELEHEKSVVVRDLSEFRGELSAVKEELVKTERSRSQLEIRCEALQETLHMAENDRDKYLMDLQESEKSREDLSTHLVILERERSQVQMDLDNRGVIGEGLEQEISRLKLERTGMEAKVRQLEAKLSLAEDSLKAQQEVNSNVTATRQQIELSLYAAQNEIDNLQDRLNKLQAQLEETAQEKNQLIIQMGTAERASDTRLSNARKEIEELTELLARRTEDLKRITHDKDSASLSWAKEKEKVRLSFENQISELRQRYQQEKEAVTSSHSEELRHLRHQMSGQQRKFDENLEVAENEKQQALKFSRSEQSVVENRLQVALTELEVLRADILRIRSESSNRTSGDRSAIMNLRNEINKLQSEILLENSRHADEVSALDRKNTDVLQKLEQSQNEVTQLRASIQSAQLKNENTLDQLNETNRQLSDALEHEEELKTETAKLQSQLSAASREKETVQSGNQELRTQLRELESERNELQGSLDETRHKLSLLEESNYKVEEELSGLRNLLTESDRKSHETQSSLSETNRHVANLKARIQGLQGDLETTEAKLHAERSRAELSESQVNELTEQLNTALNKCEMVERDLLSARRTSNLKDETYKNQEDDLRRKLQDVAAKAKKLEDQRHNLEVKLGSGNEEIVQLQQRLRAADERCETMQSLAKRLEEQKNEIALRLASVMSSLKKVTGVSDKFGVDKHPPSPIRRLAQYKSIGGGSSESPALREIDAETVNSTMRDLVLQSGKIEKERDEALSKYTTLQRRLQEVNERLHVSEETSNQLRNALGKANCEHKALEQQVASLESALKEKETAEVSRSQLFDTSEEKVTVLEGKLRELVEEKVKLEDTLNKVRVQQVQNEYETKRLTQQIEMAQSQLSKSESSRKSMEQEVVKVQKMLRDKEMECQALQAKSECLQQNLSRLQERCDSLQAQVDKLQTSEEAFKSREISLKEQINRLNVSVSHDHSAFAQLKEQLVEYQRTLASAEAEKRVTEERLDMVRHGNAELRRENSQLQEVMSNLKAEIASCRTQLAVLEGDAKNVQMNIQERSAMLESDTSQRLQKAVKEKQELQDRVNTLTRQLSQVEKEKWDIARQAPATGKMDLNRVGSEDENFLVQSLKRQIARMEERIHEMERDRVAAVEETKVRHKQERIRDAERMRELQVSGQRQSEARERALKTRAEALERQVHYLRMQLEKDASMSDLKDIVKTSLRTVASEPHLDTDLFKREISKLDTALTRHLSNSNIHT